MPDTCLVAQPDSYLIRKIPLEILQRISYYLPTPDLGCLRLTCRSIEQSLYAMFAHEFFRQKQFMVTQDSLQTLIDVSKSRLGKHLRFVHIGLECISDGVQHSVLDDKEAARYKEHYTDNFTLWNTGYHRDMMVEAFRNLKNLEDVILRDFNSYSRSRDGRYGERHSYGFTTFYRETGVMLGQSSRNTWKFGFPNCYGSQVFTLVFSALGMAKTKLKGLEFISRRNSHLPDFAFNIPAFLQPCVLPLLGGLEKLHLCINLTWQYSLSRTTSRLTPRLCIKEFLSYATNLKNLRINGYHDDYTEQLALLDWMASGDSQSQESSTSISTNKQDNPVFSVPHLEELSLGTMAIDAPRLLNVIKKFVPSLRSLALWRIIMDQALPPDTPPIALHRPILWEPFLRQLSEIPDLNLVHFKAGMLQQRLEKSSTPEHIAFFTDSVVEWSGADCKHFNWDVKLLNVTRK